MTTDRRQHSANGRVYVEGTVAQARKELSRKRQRSVRPVAVLVVLGIGLLFLRQMMRGDGA